MRRLRRSFVVPFLLLATTHCSSDDNTADGTTHLEKGGSGGETNAGARSGVGGRNETDGVGGKVGGESSGGSANSVGGQENASGGARTSVGGESTSVGGESTAAGGAKSSSGGAVAGDGGAAPTSGGEANIGECEIDLDCDPEVLPSTGDFGQDCTDRINQFRVGCHCLPPLERWTEGEACAAANAEYDEGTGVAHSGWRSSPGACPDSSGPLSEDYYGWGTNECPGWGSDEQIVEGCLLAMYGEGATWAVSLGHVPGPTDYDACKDSCYSENGHFIAMTNPSYSQVACGLYVGDGGKIWAVQNFK